MAKSQKAANPAFHPVIVPEAGARIGSVCGPCENPKDNAGTVLCQITDRWGTHAVVLLDIGKIVKVHSMNTGPGIGWHYV
jgi:hypothetical protein